MRHHNIGIIPADTRQALKIYHYYRLAISLCFLLAFSFQWESILLTLSYPNYYRHLIPGYFILSIGIYCWDRWLSRHSILTIIIPMILDIIFLNLLIHHLNNLNSPLSLLFFVTIISSSLLLPVRFSLFIAAFLSLNLLASQLISLTLDETNPQILHAGLIGLLSFILSWIISTLTKNLTSQSELARKKMQELATYEKLSGAIVSMMQVGILVIDDRQHIRLINQAARNLLGLPYTQPMILLDELPKDFLEKLSHLQHNPQKTSFFLSNNTSTSIRLSCFEITALNKQAVPYQLLFLHDVVKETQQAQQLKLIALGQLSAKIAHEIRNPLGAIQQASQLLSESINDNADTARLLEMIQRHTQRVNQVIRDILTLAKKPTNTPNIIDLKEWIEQFIKNFHMPTLAPISITLVAENESFCVFIDTQQLEQILINLCENGLYYSHQKQKNSQLNLVLTKENNQIYLDIIDYGPGIPIELQSKIFEPFFTTREGGSGLGLYVVKELCDLNCIQIQLHTSSIKGTTFRIFFNRIIGGTSHA